MIEFLDLVVASQLQHGVFIVDILHTDIQRHNFSVSQIEQKIKAPTRKIHFPA
jgi:hypothetical protein